MATSVAVPQGAQIIVNQFEPEKPKSRPEDHGQEGDDKKRNRDLPEDLQKALKGLLTHFGTVVDRRARREEVIDARRQRFYDRGFQYIYWNNIQNVFMPIVGGVVMSAGNEDIPMPRYTAVYNIYKPYRRNYCATLSANPPGVNFEPIDPSAPLDNKIAECSEQYSEHFDQVNESKKMQSKIARLFWTDGRVVIRTIHEKNAQRFGTFQDHDQEDDYQDDERQSEQQKDFEADAENIEEQDDQQEKSESEKARGEEISYIYGVLEAKCFPITADSQDQLLGTIISDDPSVEMAKDRYWWIADKIKAGQVSMGESSFDRNARIGIMQGMRTFKESAEGYSHLSERQIMYLRPAAFRKNKDLRGKLKKFFPEGVCSTFVSGEYAEAYAVSMDDELAVDFPLDGDGMNRPSWGYDHRPVQDAYNNYRNMRQEFHDYCIPLIAYDGNIIDPEAVSKWTSQPGEWRSIDNNNPAIPISNYFFATPSITVPPDLVEAENDLRDALSQLVTGVQPALFGGSINAGKDADRVGVYQMAREQAMGVMEMPWGVIQSLFCRMKYQAVLAAARNRREEDKLHVQQRRKYGKDKVISITIGDLQKGKFRAVPNADSVFPSTRAMKKQALQELAAAGQENPLIAEATLQPDNVELAVELEGVPEFDIPAARSCNRQRDEIEQLLATGPIPPTRQQVQAAAEKAEIAATAQRAIQAAQHGLPAGHEPVELPPEIQGPTEQQWSDPLFISSGAWLSNKLMLSMAKCSLSPTKRDRHKYHIMELQSWYESGERDKEAESGNVLGLANLELHWQEHEKFAAQDQSNQPQGKVSQSMNFKDLPPEGRVQMAAEAGIKLNTSTPPSQPQTGAQPAA